MKRFLTSVSLQHEPKASDVITLVKKTFFARVSYQILFHTRSEIKNFFDLNFKILGNFYKHWRVPKNAFQVEIRSKVFIIVNYY